MWSNVSTTADMIIASIVRIAQYILCLSSILVCNASRRIATNSQRWNNRLQDRVLIEQLDNEAHAVFGFSVCQSADMVSCHIESAAVDTVPACPLVYLKIARITRIILQRPDSDTRGHVSRSRAINAIRWGVEGAKTPPRVIVQHHRAEKTYSF